eukprot:Sdes_comp20667_c0_seq3m16006
MSSKESGRLQGKVAIITGGGSGIGREACLLFTKEGCQVVVADVNVKSADETVSLCSKFPGNSKSFLCDVSREKDVEDMVAFAEKRFGRLDIIFNNAGIMHPDDGDAQATNDKIWDLTMNINVKGVWYGCKHAIPALRRAGGGSIINTASFVALMGAATPQLAYTASKGAVLALSRELAIIHARENIRVNSLCPGPIRTPLLMDFLNTEEKKQRRLVHVPMGRFGNIFFP